MQSYKQQFMEFLVKNKALQFGDFTLKSGRKSPYFINTGVFETGEAIARLGYFYASLIKEEFNDNFDVIFGPAYKGISLAITTAISLKNYFGLDKFYTFNRKEIKDHADKKITIGHALQDNDRVILIDDVITDGATKFETVELINNLAKVKYAGLVVAVNRLEKTSDGLDAFKNIEEKLHFPVKAIVSVREIIDYLTDKEIDGQIYLTKTKSQEMENYLKKIGVKS
ncbi:MAG: orotate phosphoribosyltransferase [Candidatus Komeilibacteria bacterium]|nr:orotate phosphoribosyltransferase [Candidatus Komeilibacteria bacterium]